MSATCSDIRVLGKGKKRAQLSTYEYPTPHDAWLLASCFVLFCFGPATLQVSPGLRSTSICRPMLAHAFVPTLPPVAHGPVATRRRAAAAARFVPLLVVTLRSRQICARCNQRYLWRGSRVATCGDTCRASCLCAGTGVGLPGSALMTAHFTHGPVSQLPPCGKRCGVRVGGLDHNWISATLRNCCSSTVHYSVSPVPRNNSDPL